jgi:uncharacterized protein (DUF1015 family)
LPAGRPEQFLAELRSVSTSWTGHPSRSRRKGEVAMYLDGRWYILDLSHAAPEDDSRAAGLDVARLQRHVLEPLLGIGDVRSDKRIDFVGGARGTRALEDAVTRARPPWRSRCAP